MKRIRSVILLMAFITIFSMVVFAKTHKTEIISVDTIEYTLKKEDKLSCELFIEESGIYKVRVPMLSTEGNEKPKILITLLCGNKEIYSYETKRPYLDDGSFNEEKFVFAVGLAEGEYNLVIENCSKFDDVSFIIETEFTEKDYIENPPCNDFENATKMEIGEKYFGGVTMEDEIDYYKFEMPYHGYAFLQFYTPHLKHFTLYDNDKNEVGSISIEIDEEDLVYELRSGLEKGTYYVSVRPDEDYTKPVYSIEVETKPDNLFEKEYNNEKEFATVLSYGKEYQGNLFGTEDVDVYSFTLPIECKTTLDFTDTHVAKGGHYKIKLENDTSVVYTSDNAGRKTISLNLTAGTYYFTVESLGLDNYTSMAYKIKVTTNKDFPKDVEDDENSKANDEAEYTPEETIQFADVIMSDWFYGEVLEAKKLGLVDGVGDNKFNPKGNVTLAEVITMAVRIKNEKDGKNTEITTSPVGKWYNSYITFAVNSGIITMGDFDDFERNATREEVAYIFANVLDDIEIDENLIIPDVDRNLVSVYKLFSAEILKGDTDGKFRPYDNITRAEATAILLRVYKMD